MLIRSEKIGDAAGIFALIERAFGQSDEALLVDRLRADGDSAISLVAEEGGTLVGHIQFSPMRAPFRALGLAPVSVLPERQGQGIGSALVRAGLTAARAQDRAAVFVVGEPAYYRRFGFSAALAAGFASTYAGPYLMALALVESLPAAGGSVDYAPAFATLD